MNSIDPLSLLSGPSATTASMNEKDLEKLKSAATQLEAVFDGYLMEEFDKGLPGTSGGFASQIYSGMFKDAVATKVAESNSGQGLANQIYNATVKLAQHQKSIPSVATGQHTT
jgi:Rod binding domain-containing protein